jgi:2'-5' RNA ligase
MKFFTLLLIFSVNSFGANIYLSSKIYQPMPYTDIFIDQGALVKNINYEAVKALIPQLEKIYSVKLEDRGEAHITLITPPNFSGILNPGKHGLHDVFSANEIHSMFSSYIQDVEFNVVCIGSLQNDKGNLVFYLVVDSPELFDMRKSLQASYEKKAKAKKIPHYFNYLDFYPHITIGFVGDDIHGVSKGSETCINNHKLIYQ